MFDNSVPIEKVQQIIGHKDIKTTAHYHKSKTSGEEAKQIIVNVEKARKSSIKL